jgi:hypothetical protein
MLCDKYKEALIEAAASGPPLPTRLRAHVDGCARCSDTLAAQQALHTLMEEGLRSRANLAVPANFNHRVRAALQVQPSPARRRLLPAFTFACIGAAAAVLMAIMLTQSQRQDGKEAPTSAVLESKVVTSQRPPAVGGNGKSLGPRSPRRLYSDGSAVRIPQEPKSSVLRNGDAEVLIPEGQEELLVKYMEGIAARNSRVAFNSSLQHEPEMKPVEVAPIEISQAAVRPLPNLSSD